jgi:UDP-N-acetylmuramoyl-tripeptide--D-alanyl-D-alanine ligase
MDLSFQDLVTATQGEPIGLGSSDLTRPVRGVAIDSRLVQPEEVFFALKGERFDAHAFLDHVVKLEGVVAVAEKVWLRKNSRRFPRGKFIAVEDTLRALQEAAAFYRRKFRIPVLAITGSNGKTTTKEMTAAVLSRKMKVVKKL